MLKLEKVSRFKKQQLVKRPKQCSQFKQRETLSTKYPIFEQQFDPQFIYSHFLQEQSSNHFQTYHKNHYSQRQFEDSILTNFLDKKILLTHFTMMSFAIMSILLSIFSKELYRFETQILIIHSLITISLLSMVVVKYYLKQQLKCKQLRRQKMQNKYLKFFNQTFVQMIILVMHPNILTINTTIQVSEPIDNTYILLKLNTIFETLMQSRIYIVFLSIISSSIYCNTRANRLCRIYSTKNNLFFGIKALFQYRPLTFLILLYFTLVTTLGQMISLSERDYQEDFQVFENSVWFIIITMGTVGYGDYSPKTYLGRMISFTAAISGIIISSLLILTLSRYLSMSTGQNKSHVTLKRLELRKLLQKYSKETINFTTKMMFQSNLRSQEKDSNENKRILQELKKKTQKVKFAIRRIKNMVDTDNLKEQINRLFQALSESLNLIYKFQEQYSELLMQLYRKEKDVINEIQFSFTTEIQNIIKDR